MNSLEECCNKDAPTFTSVLGIKSFQDGIAESTDVLIIDRYYQIARKKKKCTALGLALFGKCLFPHQPANPGFSKLKFLEMLIGEKHCCLDYNSLNDVTILMCMVPHSFFKFISFSSFI